MRTLTFPVVCFSSICLLFIAGCGGGGGGGGGGGSSTDTESPLISNITLSPSPDAEGTLMVVSADVTDNVGVTTVTATVSPTLVLKNLADETVTLTKSGNTWTSSAIELKGNADPEEQDVDFTVTINASDAANNSDAEVEDSSIPASAVPPESGGD